MTQKYWVISDGETPTRIHFSEAEAMKDTGRYMDVFDESGARIDDWSRKNFDATGQNPQWCTPEEREW